MNSRVKSFASDSREDALVQNDKDVDALMHLKITVVELSRLDQSIQIDKTVHDWIHDVLWRMTTMMT